MEYEKILVLDFGGQHREVIAQKVREKGVFSEIKPYTTPISEISGYKGIILSGTPKALANEAPKPERGIFSLGIPVLGMGYGAEVMAAELGGEVSAAEAGLCEAALVFDGESPLLDGVPANSKCEIECGACVSRVPEGFLARAKAGKCLLEIENAEKGLYAVFAGPKFANTPEGGRIIENFLYRICGCKGDWDIGAFVEEKIASLKKQLEGKTALCALSGGVDSTVCALILHRAIGDRLKCIFVDHGLMRKNEGDMVVKTLTESFGLKIQRVNAGERFLGRLKGVTEPEEKRRIIGEEFIRVFEEESRRLGKVDCLVQGTIYPDIVESGFSGSDVIKSHHNVGGLPDVIDFDEIVEPLSLLFKDEVRAAGMALGMPEALAQRQPFPGPGLAVRVLGEVTFEKLEIVREADAIFREEISKNSLERGLGQYFALLTNVRSVGIKGGERTYSYTVALRAVATKDYMTADVAEIPYEVLLHTAKRIVNEVPGVNRVVYDITTKPPATIEWE